MQLESHYIFQKDTQEETKNVKVYILSFPSCKLLMYKNATSHFLLFPVTVFTLFFWGV